MGGAIAACRRGAIVPNTSEGFDQVEASASPEHAVNVVKFESVQSDPAPRRVVAVVAWCVAWELLVRPWS